jgi:ABC-type uncharacterized transport system involved in gliding motility auxiliary subunit
VGFESFIGRSQSRTSGSVRNIIVPVATFLVGTVAGGLWMHASKTATPAPQLSTATTSLLARLDKPVEVRFYSLLDPSEPVTLRDFSSRVEQLLTAYRQSANGKINLVVHNAQPGADPETALADGIKGFDLDKGEGCYLGVVLVSDGKKEVLPQLDPQWESALEADVSRALSGLLRAVVVPKGLSVAAPLKSQIVDEVKQKIPDSSTISLEAGTQILREAALKEFSEAVSEMQARMQQAQTEVKQAQGGGSAGQEAAMKRLQELQNDQAQRLKDIAAKSQAQIEAWKQLKGPPH